jgi:predicted 3-demethylubiquinone-9 3-methyltransferase (glyoxalase superfamily)
VYRAPSDFPSGKEGDVLMVEFTVAGVACIGLNGGQESACGWRKNKWGVSWQITPRVLTEGMAAGGTEAKRAFDAMMGMTKIDVAAIESARRG